MTQVSLTNLKKSYGALTAVDDLTLLFASGKLAALLGPSGCGKTSTLRMIAGLLQPDAGEILFDGRSVVEIPAERRGAVMVFQKHLLFPHMTVGENVGFGLRMRGEKTAVIRNKVAEMLALVQLPGFEDRRSHELSGGQQQRVALARALVISPAVLLLDEPLANLDANLRLEMRKLIRTIQQTLQMTTLFVTHDQEEAIMLADQIALMGEGRLLQEGSPRLLYEQPVSPAVARFFRNENLLPGTKQGLWVQTPVGPLRLSDPTGADDPPCPDGPVWVTVRPEHLRLANPDCENTLTVARKGDAVYMGGYVQAQMQMGEFVWNIQQPAHTPIDTSCYLQLPREHIWLMPRNSS